MKLLILLAFFSVELWAKPFNNEKPIQKIFIGSCIKQDREQPIWKAMDHDGFDLFLWAGDTYYPVGEKPRNVLKAKNKQYYHPEYEAFRKKHPIIGVWDDHDFGQNDGGRTYKYKKEAQKMFLDFLDEPADSKRRGQEGVYTSYDLNPNDPQKHIKVILLDVRYHRDTDTSNMTSDILGNKQWEWLTKILATSEARYHLIVSGTNITTTKIPGGEEWKDYPQSQARLFQLIDHFKTKGVLFISGDRHFHGLFRKRIGAYKRNYIEVMSSGMARKKKSRGRRAYLNTVYNEKFLLYENAVAYLEFDFESGDLHIGFLNTKSQKKIKMTLKLDQKGHLVIPDRIPPA